MPVTVLTYPVPLPHWVDATCLAVATEHACELLRRHTALGATGSLEIKFKNVDVASIATEPIEPLVVIFTREDKVYHRALALLRDKKIHKMRISDIGRSIDAPLRPSTLDPPTTNGYLNTMKSTHIPRFFKRVEPREGTESRSGVPRKLQDTPTRPAVVPVRAYTIGSGPPPQAPFQNEQPLAKVVRKPPIPGWVPRYHP